jgi:uncharacterized protein (TIGR02145 family)
VFFILLHVSFCLFTSCKKKSDATVVQLQDADGTIYKTIIIGSQTWMAENLKTTRYNDGTVISNLSDDSMWSNTKNGAQCIYNNSKNLDTLNNYGRLYNWYAVNSGKLAPKGWHIPSEAEWAVLETYLISNGYNYDGTLKNNKIAKSLADTLGWTVFDSLNTIGHIDINQKINNKSGFSAHPGGIRDLNGNFNSIGEAGNWWSSTNDNWANTFSLYFYDVGLLNYGGDNNAGLSVRCVKD